MNIHMNQIDEQAACSLLRQAGFTASEVDRLRQLRRGYVEQEMRRLQRVVAWRLSVGW